MQPLIDEINRINQILKTDIKGTFRGFGLCKSVKREDENQNLEIESGNQIFIDDSFDSFFYHKIAGTETYIKDERNPGKGNNYKAEANIDLVCWSKDKNFDDHIKNRLSKVKLLTIKSTDYDMYKIIARETGKKDLDFNNYLFVVNYQLLYKIDNCNIICPSTSISIRPITNNNNYANNYVNSGYVN